MRTSFTFRFFLFSFTLAGLLLLANTGFAQENTDEQKPVKKIITIQVTKETDGETVVIDTTVINSDDFDADAFLKEKGINAEMSDKEHQVKKEIIVCRDVNMNSKHSMHGLNEPDTIISGNDTIIMITEIMEAPGSPSFHHGMSAPGCHPMPGMCSHLGDPQIEAILEEVGQSCCPGGMMPFGEMKQIVVKKKRHGKKVIISFEDRDEACCSKNACQRKEERVIMYNHSGECQKPFNEERVIMKGDQSKKVIIIRDGENESPEKQEKKVIIIKDDKTKPE